MTQAATEENPASRSGEIAARLENTGWGRLQVAAVLVVGLGSLFELLEMAMTGIFGTVFAADVNSGTISSRQLGLLLAATSIGATIGSPLLGGFADRFGRRLALITALVWASGFSLAAVFAENPDYLLGLRLAASLGIGSYLPLATTYITDIIPSRLRGRALMLNLIVGGLGGLACGVLARWFTQITPFGLEGWRATMGFGAIGMLTCALAVLRLPESPRWLEARGRIKEAYRQLHRLEGASAQGWVVPSTGADGEGANSASVDPTHARLWRRSNLRPIALVSVLQFLIPWCTASFVAFIGWVFSARGYSLSDTFLLQGLLATGVCVGAVLWMSFVDRVSRPKLLIGGGIAIAAAAILFTTTRSLPIAITTGFLITMIGGVQSWVLMLYSAEQFPPALRGKATTIAYAVNRGGAIIVPLVVLPLLISVGEAAMFGVMAIAMGLSSALLWLYDRSSPANCNGGE